MLVKEALQANYSKISANDADILLSNLLGQDVSWLHAHSEDILTEDVLTKFNTLVLKRQANTPLAYLLGYKEFYGRKFKVTEDTLVPRPETEGIIEIVENFLKHKEGLRVVDVGTGSGCIGITLALENPNNIYLAVDVSTEALEVAKENAKELEADITFLHSDLLEKVKDFDVLVSNLPYLTKEQMLEPSISKEPKLALDGGKEGLEIYTKLLDQIKGKDFKLVVLEIDPAQAEKLTQLIAKKLPTRRVVSLKDLAQLDRFLLIT